MTTGELREAFQHFFEERGHLRVPGHSLIPPPDDVSTLFVIAGMQQFKPYFLRTKEPPSRARRERSAVPARGREGQRPRRGRPHRTALLLLRDDGQLLVRRLLQGRGRRLRVGLGHPGARARAGAALGDRARGRPAARARRGHRRDRGVAARRHPARADRPAREGQLLAGRRDGAVRAVLEIFYDRGEALRLRRPELRAGPLRPDHGDLQPRLHGVRPAARQRACAAPDAERRHRQRHRADRLRAPGRRVPSSTPTGSA